MDEFPIMFFPEGRFFQINHMLETYIAVNEKLLKGFVNYFSVHGETKSICGWCGSKSES